MPVYYLGVFSDFFHWIADAFNTIVHTLANELQGLVSLVRFIFGGFYWFSHVTAVLPAIFATLISLAFGALVIKLVLAR